MGLPADQAIVEYLARHLYHPRSSTHGEALCRFLLDDLMEHCSAFRKAAQEGKIVFQFNFTIDPDSPTRWNMDLVVGPPGGPVEVPLSEKLPARADPVEIWIAVDAKTIMTEHGKARRNRQRDLNTLQDILHRKNKRTIVGGLLLVNMAPRFLSPLRPAGGIDHRNIVRLVEETVSMFTGLPRATSGDGAGLDAVGLIVVSHTNDPKDPTTLITEPPAPPANHPLNYQTLLGDLCREFGTRFASR